MLKLSKLPPVKLELNPCLMKIVEVFPLQIEVSFISQKHLIVEVNPLIPMQDDKAYDAFRMLI